MVRALLHSGAKRLVAVLAVASFVVTASAIASPLKKSDAGMTVTANGSKLLFNGQPKFLMVAEADAYCPTTDSISLYKHLGIDVFETYMSGCPYEDLNVPAPQRPPASVRIEHLHTLLDGMGYWVQNDTEAKQLQGLPELVQWDSRVRVVNSSSLDVCSRDSTAQLAKQVSHYAKSGPVVVGINLHNNPPIKNCLTPVRFKNVFWTAWVNGGAGAMVSLQSGPAPGDEVLVGSALKRALTAEAATMSQLQSCLARGSYKTSRSSTTHVGTRGCRTSRGSFVIAVNYESRASIAVITTSHAKTVQVLKESRRVKSISRTRFSDHFGPLAVHIYKTS